jgi:hypothetical protein
MLRRSEAMVATIEITTIGTNVVGHAVEITRRHIERKTTAIEIEDAIEAETDIVLIRNDEDIVEIREEKSETDLSRMVIPYL